MKISALSHFAAAALALVLFTLPVRDAQGCACCSDPGTYSLRTDKISEHQFAQLEGLEFAKAELFSTDADDGEFKGIKAAADSYTVEAKIERKQWVLQFRTEEGKTGTLKLSVPSKLTDFDLDIHDGRKSAGGGPLLYKEWRMEGTVTGDGFFHSAKANYHLVLQGRGNRCDEGSDFTHWRLAVTGKNIDYCFYGALVPEFPEPPPTEPAEPAEPAEPTEPKTDGEAKPEPAVKKDGE